MDVTYTKDTHADKEEVMRLLRKRGLRITKQREALIDIILNENCCMCCKEIYYLAAKKIPDIGIATVYRMVSTLDELGAISKGVLYHVNTGRNCDSFDSCQITFENGNTMKLSEENVYRVLECGLGTAGYTSGERVKNIEFTRRK